MHRSNHVNMTQLGCPFSVQLFTLMQQTPSTRCSHDSSQHPCCPCCRCIPQVFYELHAERERQGKQNDVAIVRLEQLAPFPFDLVCRELYR